MVPLERSWKDLLNGVWIIPLSKVIQSYAILKFSSTSVKLGAATITSAVTSRDFTVDLNWMKHAICYLELECCVLLYFCSNIYKCTVCKYILAISFFVTLLITWFCIYKFIYIYVSKDSSFSSFVAEANREFSAIQGGWGTGVPFHSVIGDFQAYIFDYIYIPILYLHKCGFIKSYRVWWQQK